MATDLPFFQIDAFADRPFTGNSAAVMPLDDSDSFARASAKPVFLLLPPLCTDLHDTIAVGPPPPHPQRRLHAPV